MSNQSFRELGVSAPVVAALAARSIEHPFSIQELVLPDALQGLDVLVRSPTGLGQDAGLRAADRRAHEPGDARPSALVLVPTRELAAQVTAEFEPLAKAQGLSRRGRVRRRAAPLAGEAHQGRAHPRRDARAASRISPSAGSSTSRDVRIFVLDEADRMLDMGFQPQVDKLVRRLPRNRQTMFFSATLDGEVGELARAYTNSASRIEGELSAARQPGEIEHHFVSVTADTKVETLVEHIRAGGSTLVFVRTKRGADRLVQKLEAARRAPRPRCTATCRRTRASERSPGSSSGKVETLVATDVAARGLDLDDVTHVINFDPPEEDKGYVHRTGRTGRAGRSGTAITLVLPEQQADDEPRRPAAGPPRAVRRGRHEIGAREARLHEPPRPPLQVVAAALSRGWRPVEEPEHPPLVLGRTRAESVRVDVSIFRAGWPRDALSATSVSAFAALTRSRRPFRSTTWSTAMLTARASHHPRVSSTRAAGESWFG